MLATESNARDRVSNTPELDEFSDTIFYDWENWDDHMEWIATAPVAEIVDWAQEIRDNEAGHVDSSWRAERDAWQDARSAEAGE